MATSDSGDDAPLRKKRRAARAAQAKFQTAGSDEEEFDDQMEMEFDVGRGGATKSATRRNQSAGGKSRETGEDSEENLSDNEDVSGDEQEIEEESDDAQAGKSSTSKSTKKSGGATISGYHDFAPPPFLQKVLAKRQKEMENIRRQLPVDGRSREQKLADWYNMLSKLDKPVALLSLLSPPPESD